MEKEIMQLIQQRDLAQLRLDDLLGSVTDDQSSRRLGEHGRNSVRHARNPSDDVHSSRHWEESSQVSAQLTPNCQAFRQWDEYAQLSVYHVGTSEDESSMSEASGICYQSPEFGISKLRISSHVSSNYDANPQPSLPLNSSHAAEIPSETSEDHCKEVRCIEASDFSNKDEFSLLLAEDCDSLIPHFLNADAKEDHESSLCSLGKDLAVLRASSASGTEAETPLRRLEKPEISFDEVVRLPETSSLDEDVKFQDTGAVPKAHHTGVCEHKFGVRHSSKTSSEVDIPTMSNFVHELKELTQDQYKKQLSKKQYCAQETYHQSLEHCNEDKIRKDAPTSEPTSVLPLEFERLQREITELWDACNVSLTHRTYFFLLFRGGEPADSVYMEVERRRLSFLKKKLPQDCKKCQTLSSSIKNLRHERDMLHRRMLKRLSLKEREELYLKWGIELGSKQRRMQVAQLLWTDAKDMEHVRESALLVAKLIGLVEPEQALKEMFGLTFTPQKTHRRSFSWNRISSFRSAQ